MTMLTFKEIHEAFIRGSNLSHTLLYDTVERMLERFVEVEMAHGAPTIQLASTVAKDAVPGSPLVELTQRALRAEAELKMSREDVLQGREAREADRRRMQDVQAAANGYQSGQLLWDDLIATVVKHRTEAIAATDKASRIAMLQDELDGYKKLNVNQAEIIEAANRNLDTLNHEAGDLRLHLEELQEKLRTAREERNVATGGFVRLVEKHIHIQRLGLEKEEEQGNHIAAAVLRERIDMLNTVRTSVTRGEVGPSLQDVLDNFTLRRDHAQRTIDSAGDRRDFEACNEAEWTRDGWERACIELRAILNLPTEVAG